MSTTAAGRETVTVAQLQSSQDLGGHLGGHTTDGFPGILQHQQQQSLVMATPVSSQHQVGFSVCVCVCVCSLAPQVSASFSVLHTMYIVHVHVYVCMREEGGANFNTLYIHIH